MNTEPYSCSILTLPCGIAILTAVGVLIVGVIFYFTFMAYKHARPDTRKSYLYNPFWLFFPGHFTVEGNKYRRRAASLTIILLLLILFGRHILRAFG
jgi:hypothetical protein